MERTKLLALNYLQTWQETQKPFNQQRVGETLTALVHNLP
jgi:hypothetical protein